MYTRHIEHTQTEVEKERVRVREKDASERRRSERRRSERRRSRNDSLIKMCLPAACGVCAHVGGRNLRANALEKRSRTRAQ